MRGSDVRMGETMMSVFQAAGYIFLLRGPKDNHRWVYEYQRKRRQEWVGGLSCLLEVMEVMERLDDCYYAESVDEIQETGDVYVVCHLLKLKLIKLTRRVAKCACECRRGLLWYPKGVAKLTFE